jgi:hypothetical protein
MTSPADIEHRLREIADEKRDCNVCDGDGIKESGRPCLGCGQTGKVFVHGVRTLSTLTEAADTIAQLVKERDEADQQRDEARTLATAAVAERDREWEKRAAAEAEAATLREALERERTRDLGRASADYRAGYEMALIRLDLALRARTQQHGAKE